MDSSSPLPPAGALTVGGHLVRTLRLAFPVMLARAGLIIMVTVGTVMAGRAGGSQLAYFAISLAPQTTMLVIGYGLLIGVAVLTAQADGAGRPRQCGRIWQHGLAVAAGLGLLYALLLQAGEPILLATGQTPDLAEGGGAVLRQFAAGMPAILIFVACSCFLEGIGRPQPGRVVSLAANLVNAGLCWLLIFGHAGLPAMGAAGAALAATITRWLMVAAIVGYILAMPDGERFGLRRGGAGEFGQGVIKLLRLGLPLAVAAALETSAFATATLFAGWLGEGPLAAFQIALNVCTLAFMLSVGVSTASGLRVAHAVGREDRIGMVRAGWSGAAVILALMAVVGLAIGLEREAIARFYSSDPAIVALTVPVLGVVAVAVLFDGLQGVMMGNTRGAADVAVPLALHACSFWIVTVPLAWYLVTATGTGATGLFAALFVGLVCAGLLLAARFQVLTRRRIRPV
ncbi:MAG: MATE family efflux transporter [Dongiaceae bacterium]